MNNEIKPKVETYEAAFGEFMRNEKVVSVRCERCNEIIEISQVGYKRLGYIMKCKCGLYNDNLRGL